MHSVAIEQLVDVKRKLGDFPQWKSLGLNLGLPCSTLKVIENDYRFTDERALLAVLTEWLKQNYDLEKYGLPSWSRLADAVERIDHALAIAIKERHT